MVECIRTLTVSLPSTSADRLFLPCDAMQMTSQPCLDAASMMAACGCASNTCTPAKVTPAALASFPTASRYWADRYRITITGSFVCVNTFCVSLPSNSAETPRRPWDAMTIASHLLLFAATRIARQGTAAIECRMLS